MVTVSVIIPAYNEENRIENTLNSINEFFKKEKDDYEILIIDDGSIDSTAPRVENLGLKNSSIKLIRSSHAGKAVAVKTAVERAHGKYCLMMDADGATDIGELPSFLKLLKEKNADVVIASREGLTAGRKDEPWHRHFLGRVFNKLVKIITGLRFEDTQCGFKLFKTEVLRTLAAKSSIMNKKNRNLRHPLVTAFDVELLILAKIFGYRVVEVPIKWTFYPTKNINPVRDSLRMLIDLITIKINVLTGKYRSEEGSTLDKVEP